ncbi:NYN domain-containing protein [Nocardioides immobilis]|uniref:NYN domain-containing protein n=1 Tax=Nocardioides immobilis TaxID=2049295 RepID=A0A417Y3I0_9ACTN|nr:NYN domain-containing protein [Nocardioides immobilis]RHW27228.1 NYN domain-containing protein [Nocardioides immobilis]
MKTSERIDMGRRLVLIDIENVVGGLVCSETSADAARRAIDRAIGTDCDDHVVVATCHKGYPYVAWCWPTARRLVRSGRDGADLELLGVLDEDVASRFEHVVLVSGDGIFTDAVTELGRRGVQVTVVSRRRPLSNRLRFAAARVVHLEEPRAAATSSAS